MEKEEKELAREACRKAKDEERKKKMRKSKNNIADMPMVKKGRRVRFWSLSIGIKIIIPARPHVFMGGILDPTHRNMEKEEQWSWRAQPQWIQTKVTCIRT